jgi:hypothetical protein
VSATVNKDKKNGLGELTSLGRDNNEDGVSDAELVSGHDHDDSKEIRKVD